MKRENGFTLIELLAVIVILAVIALIATPLIMNTINDARDSAMQRSIQNIQHAAEQHIMSKKVLNSDYTFSMDDFDYKGEKYDKMKISFNDKDESNVAVYKGKCFYVLAGSNNVIIDDTLDESSCLDKANKPLVINEYGFYYDIPYVLDAGYAIQKYTFYEDGRMKMDILDEEKTNQSYANNKAIIVNNDNEITSTFEFSNNGLKMTLESSSVYYQEAAAISGYAPQLTSNSKINEYGFYYNVKYNQLDDALFVPIEAGLGIAGDLSFYWIFHDDTKISYAMSIMSKDIIAEYQDNLIISQQLGNLVPSEDGKILNVGEISLILEE